LRPCSMRACTIWLLADTLTFESHTITKMFTQTLQHLAMFLRTMP